MKKKDCSNQEWVLENGFTVMPQNTRPQAARTSQVHIFELGPKKFEMNKFM